ncbi:hypothetical protein HDV05_004242 [Chytridiales sp. JEL 0842]|nr:hypothetical protein HDV05_004242 [Chytridiales sp. JEL 0842]
MKGVEASSTTKRDVAVPNIVLTDHSQRIDSLLDNVARADAAASEFGGTNEHAPAIDDEWGFNWENEDTLFEELLRGFDNGTPRLFSTPISSNEKTFDNNTSNQNTIISGFAANRPADSLLRRSSLEVNTTQANSSARSSSVRIISKLLSEPGPEPFRGHGGQAQRILRSHDPQPIPPTYSSTTSPSTHQTPKKPNPPPFENYNQLYQALTSPILPPPSSEPPRKTLHHNPPKPSWLREKDNEAEALLLVDAYFKNESQTAMCILNRRELLEEFYTKPAILMLAICAYGAKFVPYLSNYRMWYYTEARKHLPQHLENPTLESTQAVGILMVFSAMTGKVPTAWMLLGVGVRMAIYLGFDAEPSEGNDKDDWVLHEHRRRIWWYLSAFDKSLAALSMLQPWIPHSKLPTRKGACGENWWRSMQPPEALLKLNPELKNGGADSSLNPLNWCVLMEGIFDECFLFEKTLEGMEAKNNSRGPPPPRSPSDTGSNVGVVPSPPSSVSDVNTQIQTLSTPAHSSLTRPQTHPSYHPHFVEAQTYFCTRLAHTLETMPMVFAKFPTDVKVCEVLYRTDGGLTWSCLQPLLVYHTCVCMIHSGMLVSYLKRFADGCDDMSNISRSQTSSIKFGTEAERLGWRAYIHARESACAIADVQEKVWRLYPQAKSVNGFWMFPVFHSSLVLIILMSPEGRRILREELRQGWRSRSMLDASLLPPWTISPMDVVGEVSSYGASMLEKLQGALSLDEKVEMVVEKFKQMIEWNVKTLEDIATYWMPAKFMLNHLKSIISEMSATLEAIPQEPHQQPQNQAPPHIFNRPRSANSGIGSSTAIKINTNGSGINTTFLTPSPLHGPLPSPNSGPSSPAASPLSDRSSSLFGPSSPFPRASSSSPTPSTDVLDAIQQTPMQVALLIARTNLGDDGEEGVAGHMM